MSQRDDRDQLHRLLGMSTASIMEHNVERFERLAGSQGKSIVLCVLGPRQVRARQVVGDRAAGFRR